MWFEKVQENVFITSCTRKATNRYFKRWGLKKKTGKVYGIMFLLNHVLSQQVTDISYVVIWKSTGKCLITSWTWKASNWYFKRCGLENYIEKERENVCIMSCTRKASNCNFKRCGLKKYRNKVRENVQLHHVLENQETDISNGCGLKKYRKMFSLRHVLEKQLTDISNVVVWKSMEKCFITSCTRKTSN